MTLRELVTTSKQDRLRRQHMKAARNIAAGALIGVATGAALGTLLAPQSGKQTREDIKKFAEDAADKVKDAADKVKAAAGTVRDCAQAAADDIK